MQSRPRILVIDDDPMFRSVVVALLRKDFLVSVANDGIEGYSKAKKHKPDVAVIDVQMPGWSGLETLKSFRENPSLRDVKVIMLTGDNSKATVVAAIKAGANDYIIKETFRKSDFLEKVQKVLNPNAAPAPKPAPAAPKPVAATPAAPAPTPAASETAPAADSEPEPVADQDSNPEVESLMEDWD